MSFDLTELEVGLDEAEVTSVISRGLPAPLHAAEADCFARQRELPGHNQEAIENARILLVGAGGLGSWTALALARSGVRAITIVDPDRYERSNLNRQLAFSADVLTWKAPTLASNVAPHMVNDGTITAVRLPLATAVQKYTFGCDVLGVLVDNGEARVQGLHLARELGVPAVFAMLSADSSRAHVFLQMPEPHTACLFCALPNLAEDATAPCASATICNCLVVAGFVSYLVHRAIMGWPQRDCRYNFRSVDLSGGEPDVAALVQRRPNCRLCG